MTVNLALKYSDQLDQIWTHASYTDNWINKKYNFDGVDTVKAYTVTTVAPNDYNRASTGDRFGGNAELQDTIATYQLTKDKSFKIAIDRGNYEQGMRAKKAGEVMRYEMNEQIIPMIDADRLATAAAGATAVSQTVTVTTDAYQDTLKLNEYLDECKAPLEGRVLWVTPAEYNLIKTAITTNILASGYNDKLVGKGFVGELDGVPVVKVPTSYFPTGVKAILCHRDSLLGVRQVTETRIITDSEFVSGSILLGRFIFGAFILKGKEKGVAAIVDGSSVSS
ncbi:hypothetical protein IKF88_00595 [Candidatus Saccharibacteria bacterium]|nr:hypothetical protein [Candidatus Saccharibacteria bacterium]